MPSTSLADVHSMLRGLWPGIKADYETAHPNRTLLVTCTHRSPDEQFELWQKGRTLDAAGNVTAVFPTKIVTARDGKKRLSEHNYKPSNALDFAVCVGGKVSWEEKEYLPVGELAEKHGLVWGGRWKLPHDPCHIEVPVTRLKLKP